MVLSLQKLGAGEADTVSSCPEATNVVRARYEAFARGEAASLYRLIFINYSMPMVDCGDLLQ